MDHLLTLHFNSIRMFFTVFGMFPNMGNH
jgi:hypothetical protein